MGKRPEYICWFDLETTQSDINAPSAFLLETGYVITDYKLNAVSSGSTVCNPVLPVRVRTYVDEYDVGGNVLPVEEALEAVWGRMDPYVQKMHTANELWDAVKTSVYDTNDLDTWWNARLAEISGLEHGQKEFAMGGSGVGHFDSAWVKKWLPKTAKRFVYSPQDIGNIRRFLTDVVEFDVSAADPAGLSAGDAKTHRALDDARAHLAEAKYYRDLFADALKR